MGDGSAATRSGAVTVEQVMSRGVVTCEPEAALETVAELMVTRRIHCVIVFIDDGDPEHGRGRRWGVVSDLDLVTSIERFGARTAEQAAATPVVMVTPQEPLSRAAELMAEYRTAHLIVVDETNLDPVGVVSTLDVAAAALGVPHGR